MDRLVRVRMYPQKIAQAMEHLAEISVVLDTENLWFVDWSGVCQVGGEHVLHDADHARSPFYAVDQIWNELVVPTVLDPRLALRVDTAEGKPRYFKWCCWIVGAPLSSAWPEVVKDGDRFLLQRTA